MSESKGAGRRHLQFIFPALVLGLAFLMPAAKAAEPISMESAELHVADLPKSIAGSLDAQGTRIFTYVNGLRMPICEIFWAATVVEQDAGSKNTGYGRIAPGSFVGVIHFLPEANEEYREDSHDQKLKAGYYTMRYALLTGGDVRDFLVLSPVASDGEPGQVFTLDQVKRQGRLASRTDQPAVLRLVPAEAGGKELPNIRTDEDGTCILQVKLHRKSNAAGNDVNLAVTLVNPISEEDGS